MLDYLCREKILAPSSSTPRGRGRRRMYTFGDIVLLRVLARLLEHGVSAKRLAKALQAMRKHHPAIQRDSVPARYMITNGKEVFLRDENALTDLDGTGQMSFLFVLELDHVRCDVLRAEARRWARG